MAQTKESEIRVPVDEELAADLASAKRQTGIRATADLVRHLVRQSAAPRGGHEVTLKMDLGEDGDAILVRSKSDFAETFRTAARAARVAK